ncbi:MAG TPA: gephyrin-like molybdotransferase Glp [Solirubrobacteraceae bacterium]|jgi:molybdopterin molybdotransferase|nr:gephyrin-like molybdotransferase Glp [Solirubrobacteraceae bacterium]
MQKRISIEDARRQMLEHTAVLGAEEVALDDALSRVLALDAFAPNPVPPFDCSTMDGFALRASDTAHAPVTLQIVDEARAGTGAGAHVGAGMAVRISTGAPIPDGADAVAQQEDASTENGSVTIGKVISAGSDVRVAGGDIPVGSRVLTAGTLLAGPEIGVLAAVNIGRPSVVRRPRIAFVSTGDELTDPGAPLKPGQIRDANSFALSAAARLAGAEVISRRKVGDDREATIEALREAMPAADILATVGGVSVGPHDHVRPALAALGAREIFGRVSLRPGGQMCFFVGEDGTLCFALPGNPVSASVSFRLFVVAAIDALLGHTRLVRRTTATISEQLPGRIGRTTAVRCRAELRADGWYVAPKQTHQDSHVLTSLLDFDAFAFVPEDRISMDPGETVDIEFVR